MKADYYEKLITQLREALRTKDADEMEIIFEDLDCGVAPSQIPEEDNIFLSTAKELMKKIQSKESMILLS